MRRTKSTDKFSVHVHLVAKAKTKSVHVFVLSAVRKSVRACWTWTSHMFDVPIMLNAHKKSNAKRIGYCLLCRVMSNVNGKRMRFHRSQHNEKRKPEEKHEHSNPCEKNNFFIFLAAHNVARSRFTSFFPFPFSSICLKCLATVVVVGTGHCYFWWGVSTYRRFKKILLSARVVSFFSIL